MTSRTVRRLLLALPALALAAPLAVPVVASATAATESAATSQGITGTISLDGVGPYQGGIRIDKVGGPPSGNWQILYDIGRDGSFRISLEPGRYWVRFIGGQGVGSEWWGDAPSRGTSTPVVVEEGGYTRLDPVLERGGSIVGTAPEAARDDEDRARSFAEAWVPDPGRPGGLELARLTYVRADGSFVLPDLHSGDYLVRVRTRNGSRLEGWWTAGSTAPSARTAEPVAVATATPTDGVDLTGLHAQATIAGRVVRADGPALRGTQVQVLTRTEDGAFEQRDLDTSTDADGRFSVAVPSGAYRLRFVNGTAPDGVPVHPTYWGGTATLEGARTAEVEPGDAVTADAVLAPTSVVRLSTPGVAGTWTIGRTLAVRGARFYPASAAVSYQWLRDGRPVAGANGPTYRLTARDLERLLSVAVVARREGFDPVRTVVGAGVLDVQDLDPVRAPRIAGRPAVGSTLRVEAPTTRPSASSTTVQWLRAGRPIRGATRSTYRPVRADRDEYLSVVVTSRRTGYRPYVWRVYASSAVR